MAKASGTHSMFGHILKMHIDMYMYKHIHIHIIMYQPLMRKEAIIFKKKDGANGKIEKEEEKGIDK